jgi:hypothetical protein
MTSDPTRLTAAPNADVLPAHLMRRGLVDDPSGLASSACGCRELGHVMRPAGTRG